jgi:hypothetical protein
MAFLMALLLLLAGPAAPTPFPHGDVAAPADGIGGLGGGG